MEMWGRTRGKAARSMDSTGSPYISVWDINMPGYEKRLKNSGLQEKTTETLLETLLYGTVNVYSKGEDRSRLFSSEDSTLR